MLIKPPNDEPLPKEEFKLNTDIRDFLTVKPWICPSCGLTNHGWNKQCADWCCRIKRNEND